MINQNELDKLNQAEEYFNRYFEFEDAVKISKENKEYLKTYIHDDSYVIKNFNAFSKILKAVGISACAGAAVFIIVGLITGFKPILVSIIAFIAVTILGSVLGICMTQFKLTEAKKNQEEINRGIKEQIELLDGRIKIREKQKDDYYKALGERITFISLDYMKYIPQIKEILENEEAENCEDAVAVLEQKLLMKKMNEIISNSETKPRTEEENKKLFGDPLELIGKKKKHKFFKS